METFEQTDSETENMVFSGTLEPMRSNGNGTGKQYGPSYDRSLSAKWKKSWRQDVRRNHLAAGDFLLRWEEEDEFEEPDKDAPIYPATTFEPEKVDDALLPIHVPAECQDGRDQCRRHIRQYKSAIHGIMKTPLASLEKEIERLTEKVNQYGSWDKSETTEENKRKLKKKRREYRLVKPHREKMGHSAYSELKKTHRKTVRTKERTLRSTSSRERGLAKWLPRERRTWKIALQDIRRGTKNMTERILAEARLRESRN